MYSTHSATRPAHDRHAEIFQRSEHVIAEAAGVGNLRALAHPDALVDATPEVLGELSVDVLVDGGAWLVPLHVDSRLGSDGAGEQEEEQGR
jgi:hypothetical protein